MHTLCASDIALLRAALLDGDAAIAAFGEWRALTDFEGNHEGGQFRMLPLLHANMARLGVQDPVMARLKGVHRHGWAEGQRRRHSAAQVAALLAKAGIAVMVTKGLALAQDYYPDRALRPMADIDLVVPKDRTFDALNVLGPVGWRHDHPVFSKGPVELAAFMAHYHGVQLKDAQGNEADLHWHPFSESSHPDLVAWFWAGAEQIDLGGAVALRPLPTPLLLHVIAHGMMPNSLSPLRWVADASMILRIASDRIDWDALWAMARLARVEMRVADGFATLVAITGVTLPDQARRPPRWSLTEGFERFSLAKFDRARQPRLRIASILSVAAMRVWVGGNRAVLPFMALDWAKRRIGRLFIRRSKAQ